MSRNTQSKMPQAFGVDHDREQSQDGGHQLNRMEANTQDVDK
jgi:hypothetical protein